MSQLREVRIALIGKTGVGKSAVGNTLLGRNSFVSRSGSSSATRRCEEDSGVVADRTLTVVDTPDFFLSTRAEDLVSEIERSVSLLSPPGVRAFLYVLKLGAFTEQEAETVSQFKQTYGEEVFRHTIVVFTHGDQVQHVDMDTLISQNESLVTLVRLCGGRFTVLNNEAPADREQVRYLLDIIDRMASPNESSFYTLEMLQEAQRRAEELRHTSLAQQRRQEESDRMKHQMDLERAKRETEIRVRKEIQEELEREGVEDEEADQSGTKEELEISKEQELQKRGRKFIYKYLFILQTNQFYITVCFSVAFGLMFFKAGSWAWVHGCVFGAIATAGGGVTGHTLALLQRSPFTPCVLTRLCPNVPNRWKKVFITTCGGLVGSSIMYIRSKDTPVLVLGFLAGGFPAHTALNK